MPFKDSRNQEIDGEAVQSSFTSRIEMELGGGIGYEDVKRASVCLIVEGGDSARGCYYRLAISRFKRTDSRSRRQVEWLWQSNLCRIHHKLKSSLENEDISLCHLAPRPSSRPESSIATKIFDHDAVSQREILLGALAQLNPPIDALNDNSAPVCRTMPVSVFLGIPLSLCRIVDVSLNA